MKRVVVDASIVVKWLVPETTLITADGRYYRKAKSLGHMIFLKDFNRKHS